MPESLKKDFEIMCQVLERLNELSEKLWRNDKDLKDDELISSTRDNHEYLTYFIPPYSEESFKKLIKENLASLHLDFEENFYLPPLDANKDFIPLLALCSNFNNDTPQLQLRIGMYRYIDNNDTRFQCFGIRFEKHEESNHNYYHAQFTKKPHHQKHEYFEWLPEHIPCILVPANNAVELIFSMLISLYGTRIYNKFINPLNIDGKYKRVIRFLPFSKVS